MIEAADFGFVFELLEPLGQAVKTEGVQLVECWMSEHGISSLMVVAGTAQIGVIEERGGTAVLGRGGVGFAGGGGGDAPAIGGARLAGAGRRRLEAGPRPGPEHAQTSRGGGA